MATPNESTMKMKSVFLVYLNEWVIPIFKVIMIIHFTLCRDGYGTDHNLLQLNVNLYAY